MNRGPPAPKAGGLLETTLLFSALLLKQNNLVVIVACGWLCLNVPICLTGGQKSWHTRDAALAPDSHTRTFYFAHFLMSVWKDETLFTDLCKEIPLASMIAEPRKRKGIKARTAATVNQTGFPTRESLTIDVMGR